MDNNKYFTHSQGETRHQLFGKNIQRKQLIAICWIVAIILGAFQGWDTRHYMNPDGLSYLDMGDAYIRGDWHMALNAYWSPFYSWLTGIALFIIKPSPYWEASVIHIVNFMIYLCAMACFHFFLNQFIRYNKFQSEKEGKEKYRLLSEGGWIIFGYSLFIWTSLTLITLKIVTPDMCVAGFVYLASGFLLKIRMGFLGLLTYILFGIVLGFGCVAKVPLLPIAFLFIGSSIFLIKNFRKNWSRIFISLLFFIIVYGSFVAVLSREKGRFTLGDSGKLNYVWFVNGTTWWVHWQGDEPKSGIPVHPTRKIFDMPAIYEFETPTRATYPPWYDPSYWYEGVSIHFSIKQQVGVLLRHIEDFYFTFFFHYQTALIVGYLLFFLAKPNRSVGFKMILHQWPLFLPAVAALILFCLVHVESRFLGAYITMFWMGLFSSVRFMNSIESKRWADGVIIAIVAVILFMTVFPLGMRSHQVFLDLLKGRDPWPHEQYQVAEKLSKLNIFSGDKMALIGHTFINAYWARLTGIQIIAEIPNIDSDSFWAANDTIKEQVFRKFSETNAKAILTTEVPLYASTAAWRKIENTQYFFYDLREKIE